MKYRKKTNGFDTAIFGIDLFIKYIIERIKNKKKNNNKSKKVNIKKTLQFI